MLNLVAERDGHMHFSQSELIGSDEFKQYANLNTFVVRFNGLCELICNSVIADDLMGSKDRLLKSQLQKFNKDLLDVKWIDNRAIQLIYKTLLTNASNPYKEKISLMHLDTFSSTHTLDATSYFQQMTAYILGIYPFDLFSYGDAVQTGKKVNASVLENKLAQLEDGSYIKFMAFSKGFLGFQGHAMVIKKTGRTFSFFDPNSGEKFGITPEELSGYIDSAMLFYHGTHMAFMDGKEFINSVRRANPMSQSALPEAHSAPRVEEHQAADDEITIFILAEIKKIMEQGKTDDEDLIFAMNNIRIGVEQLMQQTETRSTAVHKKPTHSIEPNRHSRDKQGAELQTLDDIRFKSSISTWTSLIGRKGYMVSTSGSVGGHDVSSVTIEVLESGPSLEEIDDFLANIGHQQPELVKNHYDLSALLFILNTKHCQTACDSLHDKLFSLIKTTRHTQILFHYIERSNEKFSFEDFKNNIKRPDKRPIVFNAIKTHLLTLIKSAYDFETILSALEEEQRTELFEAMQADLPGMIKSIGDLGDVLKHLTPEQRTIIFDAIKATLPDIIHTGHNSCYDSCYDFQQTLDVLLPEQRTIIIDIMLTMLPTIHLEDINVFNALHAYLSPEQATFFCDVMLDRLPDAMNNESSSIEPKLTTEQFMHVFQKLKEQVSPINALRYLLDSSKMLNANRTNGVLSAEQCAILFEGITDPLTDLMPTAHDFASKLQDISSDSRAIIFEIMKEKLPGLVKTIKDLGEVVAILSSEQSMIFAHGPIQQILEERFKSAISNEDAKALSAALISNDPEKIKTQFDRMIENINQRNWSIFDFFRTTKPASALIDAICDLQPESHWLGKINMALKLVWDDKLRSVDAYAKVGLPIDKEPFKTSLESYISQSNHSHTINPRSG